MYHCTPRGKGWVGHVLYLLPFPGVRVVEEGLGVVVVVAGDKIVVTIYLRPSINDVCKMFEILDPPSELLFIRKIWQIS